jgi:teichuronic acid biosynthesis glycosyltransferase TuaC
MAQALAAQSGRSRGMTLSVLAVAFGWMERGRLEISPFVVEQVERLREEGCRVEVGPVQNRMSLTSTARCVRAFRSQVRRQNLDVVHATYGSMISLIGLASRARAAYVVSFGGTDLIGVPVETAYWRVRRTLSQGFSLVSGMAADAVIVKSRNLLDALPRNVARKAVVLPNGVNLEKFRPADRAESRRLLGWDLEAKIVLFNGSRGPNIHVKNAPLAHQAVDRARRTLPDVQLKVTGDDPPALMSVMLNAADCLVVTSWHEGSPNIVKEAMACDLPVVSVPCGDVAERLSTSAVGRVCPFDAATLGDALVEYLRAGARSAGRAALIGQGLDSRRVAKHMLGIFQQAVEARN